MKTYVFRIDILRDCFVKVKAETLEEAKEKVKDSDNWKEEPERNKEEVWYSTAQLYEELEE